MLMLPRSPLKPLSRQRGTDRSYRHPPGAPTGQSFTDPAIQGEARIPRLELDQPLEHRNTGTPLRGQPGHSRGDSLSSHSLSLRQVKLQKLGEGGADNWARTLEGFWKERGRCLPCSDLRERKVPGKGPGTSGLEETSLKEKRE